MKLVRVRVYVPFFKTGFWKQRCFRDEKYEINVVVSIAFTLALLCENNISRIICKSKKLESDRREVENLRDKFRYLVSYWLKYCHG